MKKLLCLTTTALALCFTPLAWAADPKAKGEEEALQKRAEAFAEAFAKGDAKALAEFWTPNGDFMDQDGGIGPRPRP